MLRIRELPDHERPSSRLAEAGPNALADAEVLAILLQSGVAGENAIDLARRVLTLFGGWQGLQRSSIAELAAVHGIGRAKAAKIKAALEVGRRILLYEHETRPQIKAPSDLANLLILEMSALDQEHFRVACLDTKNRLHKLHTVYVGNLNSAIIRVGECYKEALKLNSAAVIFVHNHPSTDATPSPQDIQLTRQLVDAGKLLGIQCLDHLIIGGNRYVSLRERGLGFGA